nr:660_t:CDS:1 [Entrophospora candida]
MANVQDKESRIVKVISGLNSRNKKLQDRCIKQDQGFDREWKGWEQERKKWSQTVDESNTAIQNLRAHDLELIAETKRLQIKNASKDISLASFKADNNINSKKIRSLESMIKILEGKLKSAQMDVLSVQNDSSEKESENLSLKSKIVELENIKSGLELKVNELEQLKSENVSKPIVGGDNEKNITKSDNISLGSTDLSKYFVCRKNMDPIEKIDGEITGLPKNDTKINPKVSDETSISEISEDNMPIKPDVSEAMPQNVISHLAQRDNNISSLVESNAQMRPSLEALPLPIVASTLMSPLSAYICLILLIIAVMWFVVLRRTWNINKNMIGYWIRGSDN